VVTGKTVEAGAKLAGTIHSTALEVEAAGGRALPIQLDIRDENAVAAAVKAAAEQFGGLDILINTIATAAIEVFFPQAMAHSRKPSVMADAAHSIVTPGQPRHDRKLFHRRGCTRGDGVKDQETRSAGALAADLFLD
jgi:NAD(P)-dependent dehydrogenase (short-subunit alcohol dehydrogenase family)